VCVCVCLSVCYNVMSAAFYRTAEWVGLVLGTEATFNSTYTVL